MLTGPRSVYIAAMEPLRFEALLGTSEKLSIIGSSRRETVLSDVQRLCPDFLLLDSMLTGTDSLHLLEQFSGSMTAPPRVLYLGRDESWQKLALRKGADAAMGFDCDKQALLRLAEETAHVPLPKLAEPWESDRMEIAINYAERLGIPDALKGKHYICLAVSALVCAPRLGASYTQSLYPLIAAACATSSRAVEKAIRTAVESTWLSGNLNAIQSLFGDSVDAERGKPTNAEFLSMLAAYARRELVARMAENTQKIHPAWNKCPEFA